MMRIMKFAIFDQKTKKCLLSPLDASNMIKNILIVLSDPETFISGVYEMDSASGDTYLYTLQMVKIIKQTKFVC